MAGNRRKNKRAAGSAGGAAAQRVEDDDGAGLVERALSPDELKTRGEDLISWLVKHGHVQEKKKAAVAKFNADLKLSGEKIKVLTRELDTGKAYVDPQLPLYEDEGTGNDAQAAAS